MTDCSIFEDHCQQFFKFIEQDQKMITKNDNRLFDNGSQVKLFWRSNKHYNKIYQEINKEENKKKYPIAYEIITKSYVKLKKYQNNKMTFEEKCIKFFKLIEEDKQMISSSDIRTFEDGTSIYSFWDVYYEKIYIEIKKSINKDIYPIACELLERKYKQRKQKQLVRKEYPNIKMSFNDKYLALFQLIEHDDQMIKSSDLRTFIDGHKMFSFWSNYYEKIYIAICQEENKKKYPKAYKHIKEAYQKLKHYQDNHLTFQEKSFIIFDLIEREDQMIKQKDIRTFADGTLVGRFWQIKDNSEKLYKLISMEENKNKYPKAYKHIKLAHQKLINRKYRFNFDEKCQCYFELLEDIKRPVRYGSKETFIDGTNVVTFWYTHTERILGEIRKEDNKKNYPHAYEIIIKEYKNILIYRRKRLLNQSEKWDHKKTNNIIENICLEHNIDIDINSLVLNHITYKEFVVKIEYLKANGISITDNNGLLHPIFNISNIDMYNNYGIDLEQMTKQYLNVKKLVLGSKED